MSDPNIIPPAPAPEVPDVLPVLPDVWPFPVNPLPPNAGEGEV